MRRTLHFAFINLIVFLIPISSGAKDIWIQAVGIDTRIKSQNQTDFYQQAANFQASCKKSDRGPTCQLFINDNPKYADELIEAVGLVDHDSAFRGSATAAKLKEQIRAAVEAAGSGDQLVISLTDHGSSSKYSASCIYLGSDDRLCDRDLAELLAHKKPGAKILVRADGCFSGGFANLAGKDICAVSTADRRNYGHQQSDSFWSLVASGHAHSLDQISRPVQNGPFTEGEILSSQVRVRDACRKAREEQRAKLSPEVRARAQSLYGESIISRYQCDSAPTFKRVGQIQDWLRAATPEACQRAGYPAFACVARARLLKNTSSTIGEIGAYMRPEYARAREEGQYMLKGLTDRDQILYGMFTLNGSDAINKLPKQPDERFKAEFQAKLKAYRIEHPPLANLKDYNQHLAALKNDPRNAAYFEDAQLVDACFSDPDDEKDADTGDEGDKINASKHVPKSMSAKDYGDIRACEQSFRF